MLSHSNTQGHCAGVDSKSFMAMLRGDCAALRGVPGDIMESYLCKTARRAVGLEGMELSEALTGIILPAMPYATAEWYEVDVTFPP